MRSTLSVAIGDIAFATEAGADCLPVYLALCIVADQFNSPIMVDEGFAKDLSMTKRRMLAAIWTLEKMDWVDVDQESAWPELVCNVPRRHASAYPRRYPRTPTPLQLVG